MRPVGIFGGTFDPIHLGHTQVACAVCRELQLAALHIVPNAHPPHRGPAVAAARHRLAMVRLAAAAIPGARADDRELHRPGPSYMADTLASLRAEYGATPLCLMLGVDAFAELPGWHRWQTLPQLAHLVVLRRPGAAAPAPVFDSKPQPWWAARICDDSGALNEAPGGRVYFSRSRCRETSASALRTALAAATAGTGRRPPGLAPAVAAYIREHGLYR